MRVMNESVRFVTLATHCVNGDGIVERPWKYIHITEPSLWLSRAVSVSSPVDWDRQDVAVLSAMTMTVRSDEVSLLVSAAHNAFRGMTCEQLKWLA
eukprot:72013-Amphidinium_carterae.1